MDTAQEEIFSVKNEANAEVITTVFSSSFYIKKPRILDKILIFSA